MSAKKQIEKEILEAVVFLREHNHTIPSETLQFMLDASLDRLNNITQRVYTYHFDCWNNKGKGKTKRIDALDIETAKIIFEAKYPDLAYDEPYN